ncbi:MAG: hypothetical protein ACXVCP_00725 [Bdellovibrio sp.]
MKKQVLVTILMIVPSFGFAKVSDFDSLITENVKAQAELHSTVKNNVRDTRDAVANSNRERIVVVENPGKSYNAPTKADLLAFKKEKSHYRASEEKQFERLANEINSQEE